ncbi:uncharacterized protein LOC118755114 [Rhagoletis pomonella]|uniref:uncharacterized protein LOC118738667 n=1 Tax=Rhagoletis pomonella TaxID=28610 RepID=UPI00177F7EE6|nr:uncharacterized protein LOC118738667 [Rhagoletis pomonella]XP_036345853.1 uncharacterized protein LOC118755114 [Rhagoletis pomonella]
MTKFTSMRKRAEQQSQCYPLACRLCDGNHPIRLCPIYRVKSPEERLREALLGRFCGNCLSMTHRVDTCTSEERCRRCHDKHHTTLHLDEEHQAVDTRPWSVQVASEDESEHILSVNASDSGTETRALPPDAEEGEVIETAVATRTLRSTSRRGSETRPSRPLLAHERRRGSETRPFRPRQPSRRRRGAETRPFRPRARQLDSANRRRHQGRLETRPRQLPVAFRAGRVQPSTHVLRPVTSICPTAVVKVESQGRLHLIRALIDACSPTSIISADLVRELRLDFGPQQGCLLRLRGKHGQNKRVAVHARVVRNYIRISPTSSVDPSIAAPYTHIRLADPNFHTSTPIRLVLGADVYPEIILPGILPSAFGPFLAQSSIFGWILSGSCRS